MADFENFPATPDADRQFTREAYNPLYNPFRARPVLVHQ